MTDREAWQLSLRVARRATRLQVAVAGPTSLSYGERPESVFMLVSRMQADLQVLLAWDREQQGREAA